MKGTKEERPPGSGTWRLRVYAGRDPVTGKPRLRSKTVHGLGVRKAEDALRTFVDKVRDSQQGGTTATLGYLLDEWLEHAEPDLSPWTRRGYRSKIESRVRPKLGHVRLCDLTPAMLDRQYRQWRQEGLAPSTVRQLHAIIRRALTVAYRWEWVDRNPADRVDPPKVRRDPRAIVSPTLEEVRQLVTAAEKGDPTFGAMVALAALTGARLGELCGLQWPDVDLEGRRLFIRRGTYDGRVSEGGARVKETKSYRQRELWIDDRVVALLTAHRAYVDQRAREGMSPLTPDAFVFSRSLNGATIYRPMWATGAFTRLRDELEMPHLHFHSLRHFSPTQLAAAGVGVFTIMARLGHSSPQVTSIYTHADPDADRRAAELMGELMPGKA